jgi:tetratricopeptide (TPR) repeat protein
LTRGDDSLRPQLVQAMQAFRAGDLGNACEIYRALLERDPDHPDALHHYGIALNKQGHKQHAIRMMRRSLMVRDDQAPVHLNLGRIYFSLKQIDEALPHVQRAADLAPDDADVAMLLGRCLVLRNELPGAIDAFLRAAEVRPHDVELQIRLADAYDKHGDFENALVWYEFALAREPGHVRARKAYVLLLRRLNRSTDALRELERDSPAPIADVDLQQARAALYEELGRRDEAIAGYRAVLETVPRHPLAVGSLVRIEDTGLLGDLPDRAEALFEDARTGDFDRVFLAYALGKLCDRAGRYERAFGWFSRANEIQARAEAYPEETITAFVSAQIECYTAEFLESRRIAARSAPRPIFIVGMPRSGTTLVEQILSSHSQVSGGGEIGFFVGRFGVGGGPRTEWPDQAATRDGAAWQGIRDQYLGLLAQYGSERPVVTDKMPFNFLHLGAINLLFPDARIIWCRRNALDNGLSCFMENLTAAFSFATAFARFAHYLAQHDRLMRHWQSLIPGNLLAVQYESLVDDLDSQVRRLLGFAGLEVEQACFDFHTNARAVATPSNWQVRQPIYRTSTGRWRHYEPFLGELVSELRARGIEC